MHIVGRRLAMAILVDIYASTTAPHLSSSSVLGTPKTRTLEHASRSLHVAPSVGRTQSFAASFPFLDACSQPIGCSAGASERQKGMNLGIRFLELRVHAPYMMHGEERG